MELIALVNICKETKTHKKSSVPNYLFYVLELLYR